MKEAFLRVWERWDRVCTLDDIVGYLFKTAMNLHRSRSGERWPRPKTVSPSLTGTRSRPMTARPFLRPGGLVGRR